MLLYAAGLIVDNYTHNSCKIQLKEVDMSHDGQIPRTVQTFTKLPLGFCANSLPGLILKCCINIGNVCVM